MAGYAERPVPRASARCLVEERDVPQERLRGATLERLQEYLDLHDPARASFRAEGGEIVKPGQRVVRRTALRRAG